MIMKRLQILILIPLLMISGAGFAQEGFEDYDSDKDSRWNKDEFQVAYGDQYSDWDDNGDDRLTEDEFYGARFDKYDKDTDGFINKEEWNKADIARKYSGSEDFKALDKDKDGLLDTQEWQEGLADSNWFNSFDKDENDFISKAELIVGLFNEWDNNGNGFLGKDEYKENDPFLEW